MTLGYVAQIGDPATYAAANARRHVFYAFPRGAATLVGLLSLMESENTDGPHFDWHEKRYKERKATMTGVGGFGPWQDSTGSSLAGADLSLTPGSTWRISVSSTETLNNWSIGERIRIVRQSYQNGAALADVYASIVNIVITNAATSMNVGTFTIMIDAASSPMLIDNAIGDSGQLVQTLGMPMAEGSRSPGARTPLYPIKPGNYTEIIRTPMAFTRTQLNQPMFFDEAGLLRTTRRDTAIDHMVQWENALLFGRQSETSVVDTDGTPSVVRTVGGIRWYLEEYEKLNGGKYNYRPGGAAQTVPADDQKRIIQGPATTGLIPYDDWVKYEERMFRTTMTSSGEKLMIGGWKAVKAVIDYYRKKTPIRVTRPFESEGLTLNFELRTIETDHGILHLKSHPRFNDDSVLSDQAVVVDLPNLKLRPMVNADMHLNEGIQDNDFDGRKDEYFTEMGLEVRFPESHMWFESLKEIAQDTP